MGITKYLRLWLGMGINQQAEPSQGSSGYIALQLYQKSSRWVLFPRCKVPTTHAVVCSVAVKSNRSPFPSFLRDVELVCSAAQSKNFLKQSAEHLYTASVYRKAQLILQNPPSEAQTFIRKPTDSKKNCTLCH